VILLQNIDMTKNTKQPPALKRVYWTAELKKAAVARLQGGVSWAELILVNDSVGLQQGILLFDTLEAAHAYIKQRKEPVQIVVELPVKSIEKELLVRCQEYTGTEFKGEFRQWIYPNHVWFDSVKFHKFETVKTGGEAVDIPPPDFSKVGTLIDVNNLPKIDTSNMNVSGIINILP
jgi:hypothetical protein